ncbi:MAG: PEP-CTERM sorting domain-containing protein, partial [Phycisphaerae bacterium]
MNKPMTLACLLAMTTAAMAETTFDQDVSPNVIFGSGNANGGFTVDRDNGIELALRGKLRHDATGEPQNRWNSNGDGTYTFRAGVAPGQSFPTAEWSFEWSVNTNYDDSTSYDLSDLSYLLLIDTDP